jgi:hypothetical protein
MKLSDLLKRLYEESEFKSIVSLSDTTKIGKGFIDRAFAGKNTMEKLDLLFDELTQDLEVEDFLLVKDLIRRVRLRKIEREQIL